MFLHRVFAITCIGALVLPFPGEAREITLAPSSKWLMNYDHDSCTLSREFGQGDDKVIARFIRYAPTARFDFNLTGKPLRAWTTGARINLRFGTAGDYVASDAMVGKAITSTGELPELFTSGRLDNRDTSKIDLGDSNISEADAIDPVAESAVTSVSIKVAGQTIELGLGSMGPAMREIRKCTTDLVKEWGFDPEQQAQRQSTPKPKSNPQRWLMSSDYPGAGLGAGQQAIIHFRLAVDADGRTTDCTVQSAIAEGSFAKVTCALLRQRARFDPARMSDGTAITSYYVGGVRWVMRPTL